MNTKKVILTEELKKKLKKQTLISIKEEFIYVPEVFREKDVQGNYVIPKNLWQQFILRGLDGTDKILLEDDLLSDVKYDINGKPSEIKIRSGSIKLATVRRGLLGWKNLYDEDGNIFEDKKFTKEEPASDENLAILNPTIITELFSVIEKESKLTEEELMGLE